MDIKQLAVEALVHRVLLRSRVRDWSVQGFGQARIKLGDTERLQIWHPRLRVPNVTDIHTHPWDFQSVIVKGYLTNEIYRRYSVERGIHPTHYGQTLKPGEKGGLIGYNAGLYHLRLESCLCYSAGTTYGQAASAIHRTVVDPFTISLIHRVPVSPKADVAEVFWPIEEEWVSAKPRPLTSEEFDWLIPGVLDRHFVA